MEDVVEGWPDPQLEIEITKVGKESASKGRDSTTACHCHHQHTCWNLAVKVFLDSGLN